MQNVQFEPQKEIATCIRHDHIIVLLNLFSAAQIIMKCPTVRGEGGRPTHQNIFNIVIWNYDASISFFRVLNLNINRQSSVKITISNFISFLVKLPHITFSTHHKSNKTKKQPKSRVRPFFWLKLLNCFKWLKMW